MWLSGCSEAGPDPDPELMEPIQATVSISPHGQFERLQEDPDYISHFTRAPAHKGQRRLHCFLLRWLKDFTNHLQNLGFLLLTPLPPPHAGTQQQGWACSPWVCWSAGSFARPLTQHQLILRRTAQTSLRSCCTGSQLRRLTPSTSKCPVWHNRHEKNGNILDPD